MVALVCRHCGDKVNSWNTDYDYIHIPSGWIRCSDNAGAKGILPGLYQPTCVASPLKEEDIIDRVLNKYL